MYLHTYGLESTQISLLEAAFELLVDRGYRGATTREIAAKAGVTEVTLFRHFKNKTALLQGAVARFKPPLEGMFPPVHGDARADLTHLVRAYMDLLEASRGLMPRFLAELLRHPELREGPLAFTGVMHDMTAFMEQNRRRWGFSDKESSSQLMLMLIGPLIARFLLVGAWGMGLEIDLEAHVEGFLGGRMADDQG